MKKNILYGLLISLIFIVAGCNEHRDIKEMLQEKGYKNISVTKVDSLKWFDDKISDKEYQFYKVEMKIDSIIKSIPDKFDYAYEKKIDRDILPLAAACCALFEDIINESMVESCDNEGKKSKHVGMLFHVRMSVLGKMDNYAVRTDKNVTKILYIEPDERPDYNSLLRNGLFGTFRDYELKNP